MPTIIDSLIVTLGLDPSGYKKGRETAEREQKQTQEVLKKSTEAMGRSVAQLARQIAVLFVGFESTSGLINFLGRLNVAQAALSRMSQNLGISARALDVWDKKVELAGGSAADAQGAVKQLMSDVTALLTHPGDPSGLLVFFQRLGVSTAGTAFSAENAKRAYEQLFARMATLPRAQMYELGTQAGLSEGLLSYGLRPANEREALSKEADRLSRATEANAKAADDLRERWVAIRLSVEAIGIAFLEKVTPSLERLLPIVEKLALGFADFIAGFQAEDPKNFFVALDHGASQVLETLKSIRTEISKILAGDFSDVGDLALKAVKADFGAGIDRLTSGTSDFMGRIKNDPALGWLGKLWDKSKDFVVGLQPYQSSFNAATEKYGLPAGLLRSVAQTESSFDPNKVNRQSGATGLMQLMPKYFPNAGKDPNADIDTAARELLRLYRQLGSWDLAKAAYNAGPGRLQQAIAGGKPLAAETPRYVDTVNARMRDARIDRAAPGGVTSNNEFNITIQSKDSSDGKQVAVDFMAEMKKRDLLIQSDTGILP